MTELEKLYFEQPEPVKSCLLALRDIILAQDENITAAWKYGMPFFCFKGKMFCYLWVHKTLHQPYIGIVEGKHIEHPNLLQEKRGRMKIMLFDGSADLPINTIQSILQQAISLYTSGKIKLKS
ncbi:hypothetical protein BEL04_03885 [Mucilaginibacter sp. PPCGB 2223]|uniref:DUF1801 domain-containing protein n=1 Tax=Mucilaginibacter sp. PPCGB 2223 TaxID=1886027 RepID=UPI0008252BA8|nr:DUF1801 domain-containing protein [Mucilaginibacter sp. PPCGB 2223]OCX53451.1 hypothetical protein BEL04_03885 [Mucilaginibacter sp. PPCGB 2223]